MSKANIEKSTKKELLDGRPIHALAKMFPPMTKDEFAAIADDVKTNGLVDPIVLHEGKILDGVHRFRACNEAGIKPRYQKWDGEGGTPFQYVWSKNWSRRNLTPSQRAVIAVAAEKELAKAAKLRMSAKGRAAQGVEKIPPLEETGKARDAAGQMAGVNPHYVTDAKQLEKARPDLLEEVRLGHRNITAAMQLMKKSEVKTGDKNALTCKASIVFQKRNFTCKDYLPEAEAKQLAAGFIEKDITGRIKTKRDKS